jgi:CBS domain containing-hemolysin-like protein
VLAVSSAFWIALAWNATVPGEAGEPWDAALFFLVALAGVVWVEGCLLVGGQGWMGEPREGGTRAERSEPDMGDEREEESPELPREARELLARVLALADVPVESIMTPRDALVSVEAGSSVEQTLVRMRETGRTRVLVVEGSVDRILGVAHAKDLARLAASGETARPVRGLARRLLRLPQHVETKRLIEEFRQARVSIGVVGDARGRTLGLVTRGDLFRYVASGSRGAGGAGA